MRGVAGLLNGFIVVCCGRTKRELIHTSYIPIASEDVGSDDKAENDVLA